MKDMPQSGSLRFLNKLGEQIQNQKDKMDDKSMCVSQDCPIKKRCTRHTTSPHLYTEISIFTWHDFDGGTFCDDFTSKFEGESNSDES